MTRDPALAAAVVLVAAALLLAGIAVVRARRDRRTQRELRDGLHSHDRADVVHDPLTDPATGRPQCSHGVLLSVGPCPLCQVMPKGPPHCGYWCEKTPAGRCRDRCVELLGEGR